MANKFYVGQRVRVVGTIGTVEELDGISCRVRPDGHIGSTVGFRSYLDELSPIDPPRTVLADWQRNRLENVFDVIDSIGKTAFADVIEQALNQPEPPKYIPKEGEAVLYESNIWMAGVFTNVVKGKFRIASGNSTFCVDRVIPFDSSLHGSNVND